MRKEGDRKKETLWKMTKKKKRNAMGKGKRSRKWRAIIRIQGKQEGEGE